MAEDPKVETPVVESEIVNMPNAPVTVNSEPKIIEAESEPIVEKTVVESVPAVPEAPKPEETPEIYTIRTQETGDKVYAVKDKKRYWIKNPETLAKMGFYLGKEKNIPFSELLGFAEGEPIDMTVPGAEYPWDKPEQPKSIEPTSPSQIWQ